MLQCWNVLYSDSKGKSVVLGDGYSELGLNDLAVIDLDYSVVVENGPHVPLL